MAAMIRPTLLLRMDLDESIYSEEVVAEIKRSYAYVASSLVSSHETGEYGVENTIRFMVKMRKPYWFSSEEGADELWDGVFEKWFSNIFYKTSVTMTAYNKARLEKDETPLDFAWAEIEMENCLIAIKLGDDSSIPDEAKDLVTHTRKWANAGLLADKEIACVRMPSRAEYVRQVEAAEAVDVLGATGEDFTAEDDNALEEVALEEIAEELEFELEYTTWGVEYRDGSVREFDSSEGVFIS